VKNRELPWFSVAKPQMPDPAESIQRNFGKKTITNYFPLKLCKVKPLAKRQSLTVNLFTATDKEFGLASPFSCIDGNSHIGKNPAAPHGKPLSPAKDITGATR
jgi:hypothetical protein